MNPYLCETCGKAFLQKSKHTAHLRKKKPCTAVADISKPILKWVGGKTQIIHRLMTDFPTEIRNYREPFLGGGSVLFALLSHVKRGTIQIRGTIFATDANESLIHLYIHIQMRHVELYDALQSFIREFHECGEGEVNRTPQNIGEAKLAKENYYYWIRREYNRQCLVDKTDIVCSAMFIFLNKTCFRGVYRVGPNGFNVPYGHYKNPHMINREHLDEIHVLIQGVVFECCDFHEALTKVEPGDFVYLDPPYAPREKEGSFVGYTANGFDIEDHRRLFRRIHEFADSDKKMVLSNADVPMVRNSFNPAKYQIHSIVCKRAIHSKHPDATANEVIIKNY